MKEELENAVKINAEKAASKNTTADEALKYTQAACNAMNALNCLSNIKKGE